MSAFKLFEQKLLFVFFGTFLLGSIASGKADLPIETQTLLINKLTNVVNTIPDGAPSKTKVILRLADLHAEKGRAVAKQELEKGCLKCSNGEADRKQAVAYYKEALPRLKGESRQQVLTHMGHLYELLGDTSSATRLYTDIVGRTKGDKGSSEAAFSLGEIQFKGRKYSAAKKSYQRALSDRTFGRRGLASYRMAWCDYNQGRVESAISQVETILRTPKLLSRSGGEQVDLDFKGEVAKDYTVFISHSRKISSDKIRKVLELSPESTRLENVTFLAKELERLGQTDPAIEAWDLVISKTASPLDRTEGLVYVSGLELKRKNSDKVLKSLQKALRNYRSVGDCKKEQCVELKKRLRQIVLDWNRMELKAPSAALQEGYASYLGFEPQDDKVLDLAVQVAILRKDFVQAKIWNGQLLAINESGPGKEVALERSLLKHIEIAEASQQAEFLREAQNLYLRKSPKKSKSSEIRYNIAQQNYNDKKYGLAATEFDALARSSSTPSKLRLQSAELAMDSMVLLKDDGKIEAWSRDYAGIFPAQSSRFLRMGQKSVLSQTANLVSAAAATGGAGLMDAWKTLGRFRTDQATDEERVTFFKNKIILARKLKKYSDALVAVNSLLKQPKLSSEDRKFALENKVYVSELQLDFPSAFASYKNLNTKKWLELARLADLAEVKASNYYLKYLKGDADPALAKGICERLIRESGSFDGSNRICLRYLKSDKDFMARLYMEIYAKKPQLKRGLAFLKRHGLEKTAPGRVLERERYIQSHQKTMDRLSKHKLDSRGDRIGRSIQKRAGSLGKLEQITASVASTRDWYLQVYYLTVLEKEYKRFYDELLALPQPEGLTPEEQQQYLSLLSQQAAPYKSKGDAIGGKLLELWRDETSIDQMLADFHRAPTTVQRVLGPQVERIRGMAPGTESYRIFLAYKTAPAKRLPSLAKLEQARQTVRKDPHSRSALKNLLQLEKARGHQPIIQYLQGRVNQTGTTL